MIREIYVDGYRSLSAINIPLRNGVNILVGPNGGGKTNILSLFEFLSRLGELPVDEAVSSHGGIGRVFCRQQDNHFKTKMSCRITGSTEFKTQSGRRKILWYTWSFEISTTESYDEISYSKQKLYIHLNRRPTNVEKSSLILSLSMKEGRPELSINRMVISELQTLFRSLHFINASEYYDKIHAQRFFNYYAAYNNLNRQCIFNAFPPQATIFRQLILDLRGGTIFNIAPEICKQPEDSARPPIMDKNGAGLASVLHRLIKPKQLGVFRSNPTRSNIISRMRMDKIVSYIKLINDSITNIDTESNTIDNTISVFVSIDDKNGDIRFPLAQCSDGTVKWIALLTKIIADETGFSIEEPENFLHPMVQKEFLKVVRSESQQSRNMHTLLTTHSESLLDGANPEEVILVWMESGKTVAKRVANADGLVAEINRTGFGLGYYYTSGALEGG